MHALLPTKQHRGRNYVSLGHTRLDGRYPELLDEHHLPNSPSPGRPGLGVNAGEDWPREDGSGAYFLGVFWLRSIIAAAPASSVLEHIAGQTASRRWSSVKYARSSM